MAIMLEEAGPPYEAHLVSFESNDQMWPAFLSLNPSGPGGKPLALVESGAVLIR